MITEKAFAKVNLFLEITGRRDDGYHTLDTVMHTVSLCDTVTVGEKTGEFELLMPGSDISCGPENLGYKAAKRYLEAVGRPFGGVRVVIEKNIPSGAGMGGGSADAAAVIKALEKMFSKKCPPEVLSSLGADVPFCYRGGCCLCSGVGDVMEDLPAVSRAVAVAMPRDSVSTAQAYADWDSREKAPTLNSSAIVSAIRAGRPFEKYMYNTFERSVFKKVPDCMKLTELLGAFGASRMTGSGSAVFAVCETDEAARKASAAAKDMGFDSWTCRLE